LSECDLEEQPIEKLQENESYIEKRILDLDKSWKAKLESELKDLDVTTPTRKDTSGSFDELVNQKNNELLNESTFIKNNLSKMDVLEDQNKKKVK
jgi:hypothetical protein